MFPHIAAFTDWSMKHEKTVSVMRAHTHYSEILLMKRKICGSRYESRVAGYPGKKGDGVQKDVGRHV